MPRLYTSAFVLQRAFSELFFAHEISVHTLSVGNKDNAQFYHAPLVELPCVRQCGLLSSTEPDSDYLPESNWLSGFLRRVPDWLNSGGSPKKLAITFESIEAIGWIGESLEEVSQAHSV